MNLHLLRIFVAVPEHRSFSRAAETLFISQRAVSKERPLSPLARAFINTLQHPLEKS